MDNGIKVISLVGNNQSPSRIWQAGLSRFFCIIFNEDNQHLNIKTKSFMTFILYCLRFILPLQRIAGLSLL